MARQVSIAHDPCNPYATHCKTTGDGSITCFNEQVQEHYHNIHGALTEARAFYIAPSRFTDRYQWQTHLTLLDPFFGLGFNTLAAIDHVLATQTAGAHF
ncbi:MAG: hypothetical protein R2857_10430 [Vampirovibrionales bacterium]